MNITYITQGWLCPVCSRKPTRIADCIACQAEKQMPHDYCCLMECGQHEFCRGCDKGIYLKLD